MGQHSSCIQGQPDWVGPYQKASSKRDEIELYDHIRKLTTGNTSSKDLQEFENFLKNKVNPTCPQHGSRGSSSKHSSSSRSSTLSNHSKLEELFRKESSCKDINFNQTQVDSKASSVKPIIVPKSSCAVHGNTKPSKPPCKVHGHQNVGQLNLKVVDKDIKPITTTNSNPSPPSYKYPPQINLHAKDDDFKPIYQDFSDDESTVSTFSCPEFITNLLLPSEELQKVDILASIGVQSAKETIQRLEDRAESIVETFGVVLKHLEHGDWSTFCISTSRLCEDIKNVMRDYKMNSDSKDSESIKIKNCVSEALNNLTTHILSLNQMASSETKHKVLLPSFKVLGEVLHRMMEFLIIKEIKVLIDCLHPEENNSSLRMATCALAEMCLSGGLMSKLVVQAGAIPQLLNICKVRKCKYLRPLALRTLTVICSSHTSVEEFEKELGMSIVKSLLSEENEEKILCETVGLLAQVLKQWTDSKLSLENKIGKDMEQLVQNLTGTCKKALSPEMFLLCAACLATFSPYSVSARDWLQLHSHEMRLLASNSKQESYV